jgi:hypothetical protein
VKAKRKKYSFSFASERKKLKQNKKFDANEQKEAKKLVSFCRNVTYQTLPGRE